VFTYKRVPDKYAVGDITKYIGRRWQSRRNAKYVI